MNGTKQRIDNLYFKLMSHMDAQILEIKMEHHEELHDLCRSISSIQVNVESLKRCWLPMLGCGQHDRSEGDGTTTANSIAAAPAPPWVQTDQIQEQVTSLSRKVDYLENHSWHSNVRIDGLPEECGEEQNQLENLCKRSFSQSLELDSLVIEHVHRMGYMQEQPTKKYSSLVRSRAKEFKLQDIYDNPDFSSSLSQMRIYNWSCAGCGLREKSTYLSNYKLQTWHTVGACNGDVRVPEG